MNTPQYRAVNFSQTTITELMIPAYANFGGKIHGGIILSLMDKVAYVCSAKHAGCYCVTASINVVDFRGPVEVGDLVHLHASVNYVGTSSIVVGVRVEAENIHTGEVRHTNSSYFTMVAMDENRQPRTVPGLILESKMEVHRYTKTLKRRELLKQYKQDISELELDTENVNPEKSTTETLLADQRCIVAVSC